MNKFSLFTDNCTFSEVAIILDASFSIRNEFDEEREAAAQLASTIGVSDGSIGNRIGLGTFSTNSTIEFYCNDHTNLTTMIPDILDTSRESRRTNIRAGLLRGEEILTSNGCGERIDVTSRVIIIFSDGGNNEPNTANSDQELIDEANRLRNDENFIIVAIGIGDSINEQQLRSISDIFVPVALNDLNTGIIVQQVINNTICGKAQFRS